RRRHRGGRHLHRGGPGTRNRVGALTELSRSERRKDLSSKSLDELPGLGHQRSNEYPGNTIGFQPLKRRNAVLGRSRNSEPISKPLGDAEAIGERIVLAAVLVMVAVSVRFAEAPNGLDQLSRNALSLHSATEGVIRGRGQAV